MLYICIYRWTILKRAFLISVVNSVPLISATVVTALLAPQSFRHQPSVEQNIKLQSWAWLRVKESTVWAKSDKRHQIKNLLSRFPLLWCLMKTECVGSDFCCWPLIYPLHHLPSLESSLNASSLPVLNEQIIFFLMLMKFEFLQLALFSLSVQPLLMLTTQVFHFCQRNGKQHASLAAHSMIFLGERTIFRTPNVKSFMS